MTADDGQAVRAANAVPALRPGGPEAGDNAHARDLRLPAAKLRRVLLYVNDKLDAKLTWAEIAAAVGMHPFRLGRGFKLSTGMTLHQYVTRCRVKQAMNLLAHAQLSIADIALEVGFSCQSHLTMLFHKHTGTTPGAFRRASGRSPRLLDFATARGLTLAPPSEETAATADSVRP